MQFSCLYPSESFGVLFVSEEVDLKALENIIQSFFRSQVSFQVGWLPTHPVVVYRRPWSAFHTLHPAMSALETECFCLDDLPIGHQKSNKIRLFENEALGASIKPTPGGRIMLNYVIFRKIRGEKWLLKKMLQTTTTT